MAVKTRDAGGTLRSISSLRMRDTLLRSINTGKIRDAAGVLRTFFTSMSATVNNLLASGYAYGTTAQSVTTSPPTNVTVTGGTAPYTYAWAYVSGDTGITPSAPTGASTTFSKNLALDEYNEAYWRCTVTDASGATAQVQVQVILNNVSTS